MKKIVFGISVLALTSGAIFFTACSKEDTSAPVVTIKGGDVTVSLEGIYTEQGATATDDKDGDVSSSISITSDLNTKLTGVYTVTYTATDAAGNSGEATRKVTVANDAAIYEGTYVTKNPDFTDDSVWIQKVTASTTNNNVIKFEKFANRDKNNTIEAKISGSGFILNSSYTAILGCTYKYAPNGIGAAITKNPTTGKYSFSIKYYEEEVNSGAGCATVDPTPQEDKFTQQ